MKNESNNNLQNKAMQYDTLLGTVTSFMDWKNRQRKTKRGGKTMYDIKGYYKYVYENEMFDYWLTHCNCY